MLFLQCTKRRVQKKNKNPRFQHGKFVYDKDKSYLCINCGCKIDFRAQRCQSCSTKHRHKTEHFAVGLLSGRWQGGKSFEIYPSDWTYTLKETIRNRDRRICRRCGTKEKGKKLHVHHIDYNKRNFQTNNLISLCVTCHVKTNDNRDYWYNILSKIIGKNI